MWAHKKNLLLRAKNQVNSTLGMFSPSALLILPILFLFTISITLDGMLELRMSSLGFPSGAMVKNPPANAEDTGSSPGPGRSHMPRSN